MIPLMEHTKLIGRIKMKRMTGVAIFSFILFLPLLALADQKITLKADSHGKGSHGDALIKDKSPDQKEIVVDAGGLKPNEVYSVWLVNMKPKMDMAGVGEGDYSFKADEKGNAHYVATVPSADLKKWQMLEIAHHPDGDPKNMEKMGIALQGSLK